MDETYSHCLHWPHTSLPQNATQAYDCESRPQTFPATLYPVNGHLHPRDPGSNCLLGQMTDKRPEVLSNFSIFLSGRHDAIIPYGDTGGSHARPPVTSRLSGSWTPTGSNDGRHQARSGLRPLTNPHLDTTCGQKQTDVHGTLHSAGWK